MTPRRPSGRSSEQRSTNRSRALSAISIAKYAAPSVCLPLRSPPRRRGDRRRRPNATSPSSTSSTGRTRPRAGSVSASVLPGIPDAQQLPRRTIAGNTQSRSARKRKTASRSQPRCPQRLPQPPYRPTKVAPRQGAPRPSRPRHDAPTRSPATKTPRRQPRREESTNPGNPLLQRAVRGRTQRIEYEPKGLRATTDRCCRRCIAGAQVGQPELDQAA